MKFLKKKIKFIIEDHLNIVQKWKNSFHILNIIAIFHIFLTTIQFDSNFMIK